MKYLVSLFVILTTSVSALCQSPWLSPNETNLVQIEWQKPNLNFNPNSDERITPLTSVLYINGKLKLSNRFNLLVEIPISHWGLIGPDGSTQQEPHTTNGNVYLGTEFLFNDKYENLDFAGQIGVRVPNIPEPDFPNKRGFFTGFFTSTDRREAFQDDLIPIYLSAKMLLKPESNVKVLLRIEGLYSIYTDDLSELKNEFHFLYGIHATYQSTFLDSKIGITGRKKVTDQQLYLGPGDTPTQLWVVLEKRLSTWTPGLYLRTRIDEQNPRVTYVIGAQAKIDF